MAEGKYPNYDNRAAQHEMEPSLTNEPDRSSKSTGAAVDTNSDCSQILRVFEQIEMALRSYGDAVVSNGYIIPPHYKNVQWTTD
jgi:hypothetical protein